MNRTAQPFASGSTAGRAESLLSFTTSTGPSPKTESGIFWPKGNRPPDYRNVDNDRPSDPADAPRDFSPKLIPWKGEVRGERLIRLEMPGVPGTVEVPRLYRNRVGIVEPPGRENRWRVLVLRIIGSGEVLIRVRWWPSLRRVVSDLR